MEAIAYVLISILFVVTVTSTVITMNLLIELRKAVETYDPSFGAEMFRISYWIAGFLAYEILGFRAVTNWFERKGAHPEVIAKANKARMPFLITLGLIAVMITFALVLIR